MCYLGVSGGPKSTFATSSHFHVICWSHVLSFLCNCHCSKLHATQHNQLCYITGIASSAWIDCRVGCEWPQIKVVLHNTAMGLEVKEWGFMWSWSTMWRPWLREIHINLVKTLVMRHQNKEDLDWDIVFCLKTKTSNKEGNGSLR